MLIDPLEWLEQPRSFNLTTDELTPILTNSSAVTNTIANQQLVMNLRFEESSGTQALDSSPNGTNPGYLRNGASFGHLNDPHQGIVRFDGLNDYLRVASSSDLNLSPQSQRTVSLWFRVDDLNLSGQKQVLYEEGGATKGLNLYIDQGTLYVGMWVSNQWLTFLSTSALTSNRWHHVALVLDAQSGSTIPQAGALRAYLDGRQFGQGSGAVLPAHSNGIGIGAVNSETRFHDGVASGTGTKAFGGSLDDLRVYNRAISETEIAALAREYNTPPVAVDDSARAKYNTPLTLSATRLLANDSDIDSGDVLSLIRVGNASNGSIRLNSQGNVVFTPAVNFQGQASFDYTISDLQGATDKATVKVTVIGPQSQHHIGTNLAAIKAGTTQYPFLDAFQFSSNWSWTPSTPTETLNLDENGWVKSLPTSGTVQTNLFQDNTNLSGTVRYVVLYEGQGTIAYNKTATKINELSTPGRDVIDINFDLGSLRLSIVETDPNRNGNYIRNIDVVPEAYETTYQTQIFNPEFIKKTDPYDTLRFMDWGRTNGSPHVQWSDRATLDEARWTNRTGAPVEIMVELANRTHANPWFNLPHRATDQYITNFAQYVKENLDPSLTVYVEYSNEVWNSNFSQYNLALARAQLQWPDSGRTESELVLDWYSQRTAQIAGIWDGVFGTDKERVFVVVNSQAANTSVAERILSHSWDPNPKSSQEYGIDGLAIAPYFGRYLGLKTWESQVQSWTRDPDGGLNKLFDELTEGGVLTKSDGSPAIVGGALEGFRAQIQSNANIAQQKGLPLLGAEGGQAIKGVAEVENNDILTNLFIRANRDPRMEAIYKEYFEIWNQSGGDLINHFSDIDEYSENGSWGALESLEQEGSPKYNAIVDLINGNA